MVKIQILTTPNCNNCEKVKKMLNEMKVKYKVINIIKNPEILKKYQVMTAPGIIINGNLEFQGVPNKEDLEKTIKSKKK